MFCNFDFISDKDEFNIEGMPKTRKTCISKSNGLFRNVGLWRISYVI
jgi:hypothetical protein